MKLHMGVAWLGRGNLMRRLMKEGGSIACIGLAKVELGNGTQAWRGGCKSRNCILDSLINRLSYLSCIYMSGFNLGEFVYVHI